MKVTADDIAQLLASSPPRQVPTHVAQAARRNSSSWFTFLFGLGFAAFGMFFVVVFFPWRMADELRLSSGVEQAAGTVTAVNDTNMKVNKRRVMEYHFAFADPAGAQQTGQCFGSEGDWHTGDSVTIRYLPQNPTLACIEGGRLTQTGWMGCFVLIFPLVGLGMAVTFVVQRIRTGRILQTGLQAEVDVISVKETNTRVNKQMVYAIVLSGPALGAQPVTVKRLNLPDIELAQRRAEEKQPVYVLYDPHKPKLLIFPEALIDP